MHTLNRADAEREREREREREVLNAEQSRCRRARRDEKRERTICVCSTALNRRMPEREKRERYVRMPEQSNASERERLCACAGKEETSRSCVSQHL